MKKILLLILVIQMSICTVIAQGGPPQGGEEKIEYKSRDMAGIFYYDIDEAIEFMKIQDLDVDRAVANALKAYNRKVKKVEFLNTKNFEELDEMISAALNASQGSKPPKRPEGKDHLRDVITNVHKELKKEEEVLNTEMASIISDKQNKKWIKYQKKMKKSLLPERPSSRQDNNMSGSSFGRGNGMQRGGMNNGMMMR